MKTFFGGEGTIKTVTYELVMVLPSGNDVAHNDKVTLLYQNELNNLGTANTLK